MIAITATLRRLLGLRFLPARWQTPMFVCWGLLAGLGIAVLYVSRAPSYLSDDPETCINCHVMTTHYVTWQHSAHRNVATCNDCHVPHTDVFSEYAFKAKDGLWHATVFTMRWEPQAIEMSADAIPVVERNCRRCHERAVDETSLVEHSPGDLRCWDCHRDVPHGRVRSLSTTPGVFQPRLGIIGTEQAPHNILGRPVRPKQE